MSLSGLTIGSLELTPAFDKDKVSYTATTYNATNKVTATPEIEDAEISITVGGTPLENGSSASWTAGTNIVVIDVSNGGNTKRYTVNVTYYNHKTFTFDPTEITANDTDGLSTGTVVVTNEGAVIESAEADNEHITVTFEGNTLTVDCDDDSIFATGFSDITIFVEGRIGMNPASGEIDITEE